MNRAILISFSMFFLHESYAQDRTFFATDSLEYDDDFSSGTANVLWFGKSVVDTIDAFYGFHIIDNSTVLYQEVTFLSTMLPYRVGTLVGSPGQYTIWRPGKKTTLKSLLKHFSNWFSSPRLVGNNLYYWGLAKNGKDDSTSIYAIRYNVKSKKLNSVYLFSDYLETDNPGYFWFPVEEEKQVKFKYEWGTFAVDKAFKTLISKPR